MNIPFLDLPAQHLKLKHELLKVFSVALESASFIDGKNLESFEVEFASFCEARYCCGVSSGTDALRFALLALKIGPGDEVITVPNTFIATLEAISQVGAKPVLVDVFPETFNMNVTLIEEKVSSKTKAILPVHLYGQPVDMEPIIRLADKYDLFVIEDACQAHGAKYKNKVVGSLGDVGCFSFYPGKNLGACGDGGAITTSNEKIYKTIRMLRNHGQIDKYRHEVEGYNGRLDAIQAGFLRVKLKILDRWNEKRREKARYYSRLLKDVSEVTVPIEAEFCQSVWHLYVIRAPKRDKLKKFLEKRGIQTGLHYPIPVHLQKAYSHLGYKKGDFPVAEKLSEEILSLPIYPDLSKKQIEYIVAQIEEFYG